MRCSFCSSSFSSTQSVGSDRCSVGRTASGTQPNIWVVSFHAPLTRSPTVTAAPPSPSSLRLSRAPRWPWPRLLSGVWDSLAKRARIRRRDTATPNPCLAFRDEVGRFPSTLAALLRTTGLAEEHLTHSLCTAPLPLLDIPPPHVSSVKWKSCPIKKRQPGADHGRTYANVDTAKYHTRREGKKSLRGKQIG